ncbi:MAG: cell division protein ZapA [Thermodesulfobacteriota bacterium]
MERLVRFELLGHEFTFYTGAPEEEVDEIISLVTDLVLENSPSSSSGSIALGKIAVLASLNIASRYVELKRDFNAYKQETEERLASLGGHIEDTLEKQQG